MLPVPTSGILAKLLNFGSGGIFPIQQLSQFAVAQHLQNPSYYPFFRNTSTNLPSVPYSQVWVPNSLGCSSEFRDPNTCQAATPLQRSEFQLCLAPPLSFCVLIISASFLCSFSPRVITVSAIRTSISSISPFTPSVTWLKIHYIKFSLQVTWFLPPCLTLTDI